MSIENYSLTDIKSILNVFTIPEGPFAIHEATQGHAERHVYYRMVRDAANIDLLQDTFEYLHKLLSSQAMPSAERRVAFVFENERGLFAIIACYQGFNFLKAKDLIVRKGWNVVPPRVEGMWQKDPRRVLETIYARIELHYL